MDAAVDQRDDAQIVGRTGFLVAAVKQIEHEPLDAIGARGLRHRRVARRGQPHGVERRRDPTTEGRRRRRPRYERQLRRTNLPAR